MCVALERSDRRSIVMEKGKGGGKQGGREGAQALDVGSYFTSGYTFQRSELS